MVMENKIIKDKDKDKEIISIKGGVVERVKDMLAILIIVLE
jgi:hypothetical protein